MPKGVYSLEKRKGLFEKGHPQFNTGRTWIKKGQALRKGAKHTEETKKKMSEAKKGILPANIELLRTFERPRGDKHYNWKGGIDESSMWRGRTEWKLWREEVFKRDGYTCQKCKVKGLKLHPHHIRSFTEYKDLRFIVSNGITFCMDCHFLFHKIFGRKGINEDYVKSFIQDNSTSI